MSSVASDNTIIKEDDTMTNRHGKCCDGFGFDDIDADGIEPVDDAFIEDMTEHLRSSRREQGPEMANRQWMNGPLDFWLDHLDDHRVDHDEDVLAALAVGMDESLSIRDALLLSLMLRRGECDRDVLMDVIARPSTPEVATTVRDMMFDLFDDDRGPDVERCRTGIAMFSSMGLMMPRRLTVQPLASIAYILWWLGDRRAPLYALRSLAVDDSCSLAVLVLTAVSKGARPRGCACP